MYDDPIQEFTLRQINEDGSQVPYIDVGDEFTGTVRLFQNGAMVQREAEGYGLRSTVSRGLKRVRQPPFTEEDSCRFELEYWDAMYEKELTAFNNYKRDVLTQAENHRRAPLNVPPPHPDAEACLKRGQARARDYYNKAQNLKHKLLSFPDSPESLAELKAKEIERLGSEAATKATDTINRVAGLRV